MKSRQACAVESAARRSGLDVVTEFFIVRIINPLLFLSTPINSSKSGFFMCHWLIDPVLGLNVVDE